MAKVLKVSEVNVKRKKKIRMRFVFGIILFIILFFASSFIFNLEKFQIQNIEVAGEEAVDELVVKEIVTENTEGKYLFLFNKKNVLIYPGVSIRSQIQKEIPKISKVEINLKNNILNLNVSERTGEYLYCRANVTEEEKILSDTCYFMDENSFVFSKAPYFSDNVYFKVNSDIKQDDILGTKVFDDDYLKRIIIFKNNLEKIGIKAVAINVDASGEDSISLESRGGTYQPKILIKRNDNLENVFLDFFTFIQDEKVGKEIDGKYKSLEYINLRFGNKIYYKFRN